MFSSLEISPGSSSSRLGSSAGTRRSKWPTQRFLANRRPFGYHTLCRLPCLALWTIIVICILYKSLGTSPGHEEAVKQPPDSQSIFRRSSPQYEHRVADRLDSTGYTPSDQITQTTTGRGQVSTTTKGPGGQYVRSSKVFILIIQDETYKFHLHHRSPYNKADTQHQLDAPLTVSPHILSVIDTLHSHRIDYTIGTTKSGLPTRLLTDQDGQRRQYSVIIIDDFIKYTKLSRWNRDQLDRHCRANQIGVIAYLTYESIGQDAHTTSSSSTTRRVISGEDESSVGEFPLRFRAIDQRRSCRNSSAKSACLFDYQLNSESPILRILKRRPGAIIEGQLAEDSSGAPWISVSSNHITYEPISWARIGSHRAAGGRERANVTARLDTRAGDQVSNQIGAGVTGEFAKTRADSAIDSDMQILSMLDRGLYDGIRRVLFGGTNQLWVDRVLLLDAIEHLSAGAIFSPLERFVQVDIDDVFVGETGKRLRVADVEQLIRTQTALGRRIAGGFRFNLGFSGRYYQRGTDEENAGDAYLVSRAREFTWFCHFWSHAKAHLFEDAHELAAELTRNLEFAYEKRLPLIGHGGDPELVGAHLRSNGTRALPPTYAVAPHHSGVYPAHEQLYQVWRAILNVRVTSTEEYPHLRPASGRRGFVHKTIEVLPRQTCGLYTHTIYRRKYPGGADKLEASIRGGELFLTLLHNPVNVYMSHMTNYASDRLAPYTFETLAEFVANYTNLSLRFAPSAAPHQLGPAYLADYYFGLHPDERTPIWTNPCADKRHLAIWSEWKRDTFCPVAPRLLLVGPQKTGSTAMYAFLRLNPQLRSLPDDRLAPDFEEIQFFDDKYYANGIDWYFGRFLGPPADGARRAKRLAPDVAADLDYFYFDKSATYFDDPQVPRRSRALLPDAKIVILLVDPADRAYSWYQHVRAHNDSTALRFTFEQVVVEAEDPGAESRDLRALRSRCLRPGLYAQHLMSWLDHYPSRQVIIVDGGWFRVNPVAVMSKLQTMLRLDVQIDYAAHLTFDEAKGFYCPLHQERVRGRQRKVKRCLGAGKGRRYEPMSGEARAYLNRYYWQSNRQLAKTLTEIGQPLPEWLDKLMRASVAGSTRGREERRRRAGD